MKVLIFIIDKINKYISGYIQAWFIFILMWLVLAEVTTRYILKSPLSISNEIGGFALVCITFMGLAYTWQERGHVRVEFIFNMFPKKMQQWVRFLTLVLALGFAVILIKASYDFVQISIFFQDRSERLRIPLVYPQLSLLVGSGLLALQLVGEVLKSLQLLISSPGDRQ
jgi:TRAP-type C4-dicarboxylate transport system permease small subunit